MSRRVSAEAINLKTHTGRYAAQWLQWLDGTVWELTPGEDFDCSIEAFRAHAYYTARQYGVSIRTKIKDGKFYLQVDPPVTEPQLDLQP